MTSAKHLAEKGNMYLLIEHLGNPETTIVKSELYLALGLRGQSGYRVPDLLVAFDVDPELYEMNNGYAISEQRKPPDFVLEIASPPPERKTTTPSGATTPGTAFANTGGSTRRTLPAPSGWRVTGWLTASTNRCLLKSCPMAACKGTARP